MRKMKVREIQDEIIRLKKEKNFCILAHAYQSEEILEIADYTGDSFGLSVEASKDDKPNVIMCGVRFMAETCKVLSPEKKVFLANPVAGCPMAEQMTVEELKVLKEKHQDAAVVCYINTTSELKTLCDVSVTSSSAVRIVKGLDAKKIIFIPDPNLGAFVKENVPEKEFIFYNGGCPRHQAMTVEDLNKVKSLHPNAKFLVHPECPIEVVDKADYVGATTGIMKYAKESDDKEFIIGTENSIVEHLQYECPDKRFYPLSVNLSCTDMRVTTLMDVYNTLKGIGGEEIILEQDVLKGARKAIDNMINS